MIISVRSTKFGHDRLENEKYSSLVRKVQEMTEKEARAQSQGSKDKTRISTTKSLVNPGPIQTGRYVDPWSKCFIFAKSIYG